MASRGGMPPGSQDTPANERRLAKAGSETSQALTSTTLRSATKLVDKLMQSAALPAFVEQLQPRVLHKLVAAIGVQDAAPIMALAPVESLVKALDVAVWKSVAPGAAETFDADEFTNWLDVWLAIGDGFAAERLLALEEDYLGTALAALIEVQSIHVRGFEGRYGWKLENRFDAAVDYEQGGGFDVRSVDDLVHDARWRSDDLDARLRDDAHRPRDEADDFDRDTRVWAGAAPSAASPTDQAFFGEYVVGALVSDEWDIVLNALNALWGADPDALIALLGRLAASPSMLALGDHRTVLHDDVARARELAQAGAGFVTPLGARAFFAGIAATPRDDLVAATAYDNETAQYFIRVNAAAQTAANSTTADPSAALSHERSSHEEVADRETQRDAHGAPMPTADDLAELQQLLIDAGVELPRGATAPEVPRLAMDSARKRVDLRAALATLAVSQPELAAERMQELAYLANTLVAGVQRNDRAVGDDEAAQIALATVDLGFDWLTLDHEQMAIDCLHRAPGAVRLFGIGWQLIRALPERVLGACTRGIEKADNGELSARRAWLLAEARGGLADLARSLQERAFEPAREALTMLSLVLDADACRQLRPLLDDVPRIAGNAGSDEPRWIAGVDDLERISGWLERLG